MSKFLHLPCRSGLDRNVVPDNDNDVAPPTTGHTLPAQITLKTLVLYILIVHIICSETIVSIMNSGQIIHVCRLGPPGFNYWFCFAPVFQWFCSTPQGSPGVGRNTFLSSPHRCFIIVFICDLFVSRDDPLMS